MSSLPPSQFVQTLSSNTMCISWAIVHSDVSVAAKLHLGMHYNQCLIMLEQIADKCGWYVTHIQETHQHVAVLEQKIASPVGRPARLFHATPKKNAASLIRTGIRRSKRSKTWTSRSFYTSRAFFALSLDDAIIFIQSHDLGGPAVGRLPLLKWSQLNRWEVFMVRPGARRYFKDALFPTARWTDRPIPPGDVRLIRGWRKAAMALAMRRAITSDR